MNENKSENSVQEELRKLNRALRTITAVNHSLVRAADEASLLRDLCRLMVTEGGYRMAWIGYVIKDEEKTILPIMWEGVEDGYLTNVTISYGENEFGMGPAGIAVRTGSTAVFQDIKNDIKNYEWKQNVLQRGYAAIIALPLKNKEEIFGIVGIISSNPDAFDKEETKLLEQLANDLAYGIISLRNREQLKNLAIHLENAREAERKRVAREIHDELGQYLTGLTMDITFLREMIEDGSDKKKLLSKIDSAAGLLETTVKSVRRISSELRPAVLDSLGLLAAIEWQAEEFNNRMGITCEYFITVDYIDLPFEVTTLVFRILQESLTNAAKHSGASLVTITFGLENDYYQLEIKDNGRGIKKEDFEKKNSFGLLGMRERAEIFKGTISITSEPGKGTTISVLIPAHVNRSADHLASGDTDLTNSIPSKAKTTVDNLANRDSNMGDSNPVYKND